MAGFLPGQRPDVTSYGQTVTDRRPVKDPSRETSAAEWNNVRADLAFVGKTCPVLVASFDGTSTPTVIYSTPSAPSIAYVSTGVYNVTMPANTIARAAMATVIGTAGGSASISLTSSTVINVRTFSAAGGVQNQNFTLVVW